MDVAIQLVCPRVNIQRVSLLTLDRNERLQYRDFRLHDSFVRHTDIAELSRHRYLTFAPTDTIFPKTFVAGSLRGSPQEFFRVKQVLNIDISNVQRRIV